MSVTIQIMQGEPGEAQQPLVLDKTTILIGRGADQDVGLRNDSVSRRHCVIEKRDGQWSIIDEDSANGIYVNGQRVQKMRVIKHEDVIEVGDVMMRVGLDRKLAPQKASAKADVPAVVRMISLTAVLLLLAIAGSAMFMIWQYRERMATLTSPLPVALGETETHTVFSDTPDQTTISYQNVKPLPYWLRVGNLFYRNPVPEWNTSDIWNSQRAGQEPRLFEGLDLDLTGGQQVVSSGYFYYQSLAFVRDVSDPVGQFNVELEGWSGLGRYANTEDVPLIRRKELPNYFHAIDLYPAEIKDVTHPGWSGVQLARFSLTRTLDPPSKTNLAALAPPLTETLITKLVPAPQTAQVPFEGRLYSFFKDGNRYNVTVRGSAHLMHRFEGGIDALAKAIADSVQIAPVAPRDMPSSDTLAQQIKQKTVMLIAALRRPSIIDALTYPDLKASRELLLTLQQRPEPFPGEEEMRHLYFQAAEKCEAELKVSMARIYDGRFNKKDEDGEKELLRIRGFMAGYPPLTMERGQPGYPEWQWYYEDWVNDTRAPYTKLKIARPSKR